MARLSAKQLAALSPAERKARAKRLAYNKKYDMKKHAEKVNSKLAKVRYNTKYDATKKAQKEVAETVIERVEVLLSELKDTNAKRASILNELRATFLS